MCPELRTRGFLRKIAEINAHFPLFCYIVNVIRLTKIDLTVAQCQTRLRNSFGMKVRGRQRPAKGITFDTRGATRAGFLKRSDAVMQKSSLACLLFGKSNRISCQHVSRTACEREKLPRCLGKGSGKTFDIPN